MEVGKQSRKGARLREFESVGIVDSDSGLYRRVYVRIHDIRIY
jgi:hypothetical protein